MMNQQPDNFFREKLQAYHKPVPAGAWDKIESNLVETKKPFAGWWKIAASLLLLITATYLLWPTAESTKESALAHTNTETQTALSEKKNSKILETQNPIKQDLETVTSLADQKTSVKKNKTSKKSKTQKLSTPPAESMHVTVLSEAAKKNSEASEIIDPIPVNPHVEVKNKPASKAKHITLKFTVEETNEYLDKNAVAQATSEEKKSSTFKKLLKKANDLKSNQDPFGDLREKKNEILALNFKNEKRGQNK